MTYPSLESFYAGDDRRRRSRERDVGLWWRGRAGATFRAAWVEQTGELYLFEHVRPGLRGGGVHVLPRRFTEDELEHVFAGWRHVCGRPSSVEWFTTRSAQSFAGRLPDASSSTSTTASLATSIMPWSTRAPAASNRFATST